MTKIGLDAGHYVGDDRVPDAFIGQLGTRDEYTLNLRTYNVVAAALKAAGYAVVDIGQQSLSVTTRAKRAGSSGCDAVISLHHNAGGGQGISMFRHTNGVMGAESLKLQNTLYKYLKNVNAGNRSNPVTTAELGVINCTNTKCPAVLIECAFMDNQADVDRIKSPDYNNKLALAIVSGLNDYFGKATAPNPVVSNRAAVSGTITVLQTVNTRNSYSFADSAVIGRAYAGEQHQVVESAVVDGTLMYKTATGRYITGASKYVKFQEGIDTRLTYSAHVQTYGNLPAVANGCVVGTVGERKRLEAIIINCDVPILCQVHVQKYGWLDWAKNGVLAGTIEESKRLEAIRIKRTDGGNIKYRVHMQGLGWGPWVSNGEIAGTTGQSRRIEAIQIIFD